MVLSSRDLRIRNKSTLRRHSSRQRLKRWTLQYIEERYICLCMRGQPIAQLDSDERVNAILGHGHRLVYLRLRDHEHLG